MITRFPAVASGPPVLGRAPLAQGVQEDFMDEDQPWRPKLKNAPLFNPFESSTEWTAQLGAADRIEVEDEVTTEDNKTVRSICRREPYARKGDWALASQK